MRLIIKNGNLKENLIAIGQIVVLILLLAFLVIQINFSIKSRQESKILNEKLTQQADFKIESEKTAEKFYQDMRKKFNIEEVK